MASSSSTHSTVISSPLSWNHDVFLNFRGEDTRKTFVDHLYSALVQRGIHTCKDDETLPRGESISESLLKAIEESHIVVVVFSKNYADSTWCLDELAHIMKCKDTRGQIVMPIFYGVDPSEVRKQKLKYSEAFTRHELENKNKVESWRKALVDASNLCGWEPKHVANGHESKCIKEIVDTISDRLHPAKSSVNGNLVGIESRMQDLIPKLQIQSGGVLMIGIWGVGGGGKTTLASSVYYEISHKFDGCCFVENVREESSKHGLKLLQEKILYDVLKQRKVEIRRVEEGEHLMKSRLCHKKVLIVLDDVDKLDQLNALAGSHDWFGEGSRIIITTRDNHLLNAHKVNVVHNVCLLNDDEGMEVFSKHALQNHPPIKHYELLSTYVVSYSKGLPLALKVLGSFLCDKDVNEWLSALARLKEIPDTDIVEKLKVSFDGLKSIEKELFLDISCFFRGVKKNIAIEILDACGFHPVIGVKVLIEKALITIQDGKFDMHDLVQEMGHYIVRGEHLKNPEKHSRVWNMKDVLNICRMDATTKMELDKIKAMQYTPHSYDPLPCHLEVVANMKKLRWINWRAFHVSPLPTSFPPKELCCLMLSGFVQKRLWEGYKYLPNLRMIKLQGLENLKMTPDFDGLPNLERFMIFGCPYLEDIHPSLGRLQRLLCVILHGCVNLKTFPPITHIKKLESLVFSGCAKLLKLTEIEKNIEKINNSQLVKHGKEVASYRQYCTNFLVTFWDNGLSTLCGDTKFMQLSQSVECLEEHTPSSPHNNVNKRLRKLVLNKCNLGDEEISSNAWKLPNLEELHLTRNKFSKLNISLLQVPRLKWLDVSRCENLVEVMDLPSSIAILIADLCTSLESVGDISKCKWLWKVSFLRNNKVSRKMIVYPILEGNSIEEHFISIVLSYYNPKRSMPKQLVSGNAFMLQLPNNWTNDFCGFLISIIRQVESPRITISIKREQDMHSENKVGHEALASGTAYLGYVSFSSLRHISWLNSACSLISFSFCSDYKSLFGVELVPRKGKGGHDQTTKGVTDFSEFWDDKLENGKTFTIQHDLNSCIKIIWNPLLV
ncbi:disease resistance protein Roq1-like [Bidens hawaiensis]|uniref:disease resistance protein Roq1-like n=1 Tax=Bidens hawaiensis TaxID=980011 RepID=UPI00404A3183